MFHSKKNEDEDEDDEFHVSPRTSSKLAALFNEDSPLKTTKDLKYVAPKQPLKGQQANSAAQRPVLQNEDSKMESNSAILYATAAELYSNKKGTTTSEGRVMGCILRRSGEENFFVFLIYRTKKNVIAQARIRSNFNLVVQRDNYVNFTDDVSIQWSLHIDGIKYQEFLTQIGICKALSTFGNPSPPPFVTQFLSEGEGNYVLQKGDAPVVTLCSWLVQNHRRGKQIDELKENVKLKISKNSWEAGLVGCRLNQHCLVFVPNNQNYEHDKSLIVYEVTIEMVKKSDQTSSQTTRTENHSSSHVPQGNEATNKAALISRMAKVGQPLLPATPRHFSNLTTDSESELEEGHYQNFIPRHTRSSTSSSLEEISVATKAPTKGSPYPAAENNNQIEGAMGEGAPLGVPFMSQRPGAVVTYHSFPFPQQQQAQEAPSRSESLLPLLFSESRSQNTDLRVALSQLSQKVDMIYTKVSSMGTAPHATGPSSQSSSGLGVVVSPHFNPRDLLTQITGLVEQLESYQQKLSDNERKMDELTKDYAQVLRKNQALLEEKAELLALKEESKESKNESKVSIQELLVLQEKKIKLEAELHSAQAKMKELQNECNSARERVSSLESEFERLTSDRCRKEKENDQMVAILREVEGKNKMLKQELEARRSVDEEKAAAILKAEKEVAVLKERAKWAEEEGEKKRKLSLKLEEEKSTLESRLHEEEKNRILVQRHADEVEKLRWELDTARKELDNSKQECRKVSLKLQEHLKAQSASASCRDTPSDNEALIKQIMNATYKRLKTVFLDSETYEKNVILQSVLAALRDTTLQYLEKPKTSRVENQKRSGSENSNSRSPHSPLTPAKPGSTTSSPSPISGTSPVRKNSDRIPNSNCVPSIPDPMVSKIPTTQGESFPNTPIPFVPSEFQTSVGQISHLESVQPNEARPSSAQISSSPLPPTIKKEEALIPTSERVSEKTKNFTKEPEKCLDENDWRPVPPPPPLFSDSEDDNDWLS